MACDACVCQCRVYGFDVYAFGMPTTSCKCDMLFLGGRRPPFFFVFGFLIF